MIDFIKCLQDRNLLRTGEYMVISVDDEIYNPRKHYSILRRGKFVYDGKIVESFWLPSNSKLARLLQNFSSRTESAHMV